MPPKKRQQSSEKEANTSKKTKLDPSNLKPSQCLYIKNLNDKINRQLLKHNLYLLFSTFGDVIEIRIRKGFAHVLFGDIPSATVALRSLQSEEFFDKPLVINYSVNESKVITRLSGHIQEGGEDEDVPRYEEEEED
ncbi:uncharacterized protein SPAPADRAFT_153008 [Spathaspora passalidarum NRRL Y-27907]|uniref:RRM domain-containing protein n=1 Tax=Spathaspora passalidarum (strain NRRL Y-27907 / 11-Y1) TaxID=619300 RepID=G3APW6_SPAPN|nr:uncharacterized protein SPAPADRAFT_153008 [Spathaspora passalidarum NRRL Y-27907]EGW32287.1 hypothetical protein SPAPADRAFT_153008 [Spathaspora passalidarum NRRL Y-27907]